MSTREILLNDLVGRTVHDVDGRAVGRIQELHAEIELHEHGNDYVVREFHIGIFGAFEALAGTRFTRMVMHRLSRFSGYRTYSVPWEQMDLSDPERPRATQSKATLLSRQAISTST
jgi:sporulation protein YlmC with PRC-barrel domain